MNNEQYTDGTPSREWTDDEPVNHNGTLLKVREALEQSIYALDRAVCFKHPNSGQKKIEEAAINEAKQALAALDALIADVPESPVFSSKELPEDPHASVAIFSKQMTDYNRTCGDLLHQATREQE